MSNSTLSELETRRFRDQIAIERIGPEGQLNIRRCKVAVIGAGGIGSAVLQILSSIGIGSLGIIDFRVVEEISMQRQTLFGGNDLGKLKTILSKERLQHIFSMVNYEIINIEISSNNAQRIFSGYDIIIDTSNETSVIKLSLEACKTLKIPLITGHVNYESCEISVYNFCNEDPKNEIDGKINMVSENLKKGKISIVYHLAGTFICNEVVNLLSTNVSPRFFKRISFDLATYMVKVNDSI